MKEFDESDYIKQKALAVSIVNGFFAAHEKLSKKCYKQVEIICELEARFEKEQDERKLNLLSAEISKLSDDILTLLAVKNRVDMIIFRNKKRIEFFNQKLEIAGIYNEKFNRAELAEMEKQEIKNINEKSINLNDNFGVDKKKCYFAGDVLLFNGTKIDFSDKENEDTMILASQNLIHQIVFKFPSSVESVTGDLLLNTRFKQNLMKEIVAFVTEQSKSHSIKDINNMLGGLLSFKTQMPKDVESYIAGVNNMFNVMAKGELLEKFPEESGEIHAKLRCNEKSELIPQSKKVAVLSGGLAAEQVDTAEWESEDVRLSQEKETNMKVAIDSNLAKIYDEPVENKTKEKEKEEKAKAVKKAQKLAQETEEEKLNRELEEMLFAMYKNDNIDG